MHAQQTHWRYGMMTTYVSIRSDQQTRHIVRTLSANCPAREAVKVREGLVYMLGAMQAKRRALQQLDKVRRRRQERKHGGGGL